MVNFPGHGRANADYAAAPASQLAKVPADIPYEAAAATTLSALTALQALQSQAKRGDRVLTHAASIPPRQLFPALH